MEMMKRKEGRWEVGPIWLRGRVVLLGVHKTQIAGHNSRKMETNFLLATNFVSVGWPHNPSAL